MSTEEKNEVIALFMGLERTEKESGEHTFKQEKNSVVWASQLKYDSSWEWLMPVVEKIEGLGFRFEIHNDSAMIKRTFNSYFRRGQYLSNLGQSKKEATFNTAFDFIEWYNSNVKIK